MYNFNEYRQFVTVIKLCLGNLECVLWCDVIIGCWLVHFLKLDGVIDLIIYNVKMYQITL